MHQQASIHDKCKVFCTYNIQNQYGSVPYTAVV